MTSEWHLGRRRCLLVTSHWSRDLMTSQALGGRRADGFRGSLAPALNLIYRPAWPWETVPRGSVWLFVEMILSVGCRWLSFIFFGGGFLVIRNVGCAWRQSFWVWFIRLLKLNTRECRLAETPRGTPFICGDCRFLFFPGTLTCSLRMTFIKKWNAAQYYLKQIHSDIQQMDVNIHTRTRKRTKTYTL